MQFDIPAFVRSMRLMAEGWLGVFAVMAGIIAVIVLLNRLTGGREVSAVIGLADDDRTVDPLLRLICRVQRRQRGGKNADASGVRALFHIAVIQPLVQFAHA